jgi:ABC-2 type transport system ATP-binding protein
VISLRGLTKDFGSVRAVDQVSFDVPNGQILGFLGPNGAGKTTTMKMITGFLAPSGGTGSVGGHDIQTDSLAVRRMIGYLPENAPLYAEMTVSEFLSFAAEVRGLTGAEQAKALDRARELCALEMVWHQPIETLSRGYRQRVGFAQAVIHDPPVLVLDEPTDGLDPNQKHEVRQLIKRMGADKTIILSTHILEEVEAVCSRAIIIARGRLVADSTPAELMRQSSFFNAVTMTFASKGSSELERARELLAKLPTVESVEAAETPASLRVFPRERKLIVGDLWRVANEQRWEVSGMHVERGRLDEVFRRVTKGDQTVARQ